MRIARTDHPNQFDFYLCCSRYLPYNWLRQQCWQHQRSVTISALDSTRRSVTFVADFSELETVARNLCENCQKLLTAVVRRELLKIVRKCSTCLFLPAFSLFSFSTCSTLVQGGKISSRWWEFFCKRYRLLPSPGPTIPILGHFHYLLTG